ncbi:hypothetical protein A3K29_04460 [Candidatus Collierbacteria bacterium RIFOXYB2_FULL_46_14]|uniref:Uncharacterized protein n=1 Tax=Candidatus Collierbacteria bacterium GW2011_GWA2_46_26 TaxID=1618381 RepID=A0A0G1RU86_9BACT|nr:MAG: hypothetical protein UW29_C0002G0071 [Candidatus Collierbacteria bacterium GW2011_GWC2_44_13]KKU33548.1 MAG: hypothetical protein UX47_C0003G0071 [Candidatus Collierbacteria bacterium GW2011_GWA2_46_26]OGD73352.1 MAG: hypothetical protein A3K29_04460 [Candidatus Collierbacteria bacterium RIFOXYB2_FULL_46_14]OGD76394.1 MAG: hypothetical protein A3K43_04460 [Candidatus Collierbacteria bacterium RIFOXYA2_FULL_46_20]OGD77730.1 MAG: hypothetical protein A3K39_04460 [Candidatus Collierbacteri
MPEFLLRYKLPEDLDTATEEEVFVNRMCEMADRIQQIISSNFFGWDVSYEVREFGHTRGMPDLYVTAWVTDNSDAYATFAEKAVAEIQDLMRSYAWGNQKVGCWFQRVKGKWSEALGRRPFLPITRYSY